MNQKNLWLDVDGVLLDYTSAFLSFTGLDQKGITYDNLFDYDLTKLFGSTEETREWMYKFTQSKEFKRLPAIALRTDLEMLKNMGWKLRVITMLPTDPIHQVTRVKNLSIAFGPVFEEILFTHFGQNKLDIIEARMEQGDTTVVVEDSPTFLEDANGRIGHKLRTNGDTNLTVVGIVHPYNQERVTQLEYIILAHTFEDAAEIIATGDIIEMEKWLRKS